MALVAASSCRRALVEASDHRVAAGTIVVLANWSGKPVKALQATIDVPFTGRIEPWSAAEDSCPGKRADTSVFTFDLDVAGVLVLRRR